MANKNEVQWTLADELAGRIVPGMTKEQWLDQNHHASQKDWSKQEITSRAEFDQLSSNGKHGEISDFFKRGGKIID